MKGSLDLRDDPSPALLSEALASLSARIGAGNRILVLDATRAIVPVEGGRLQVGVVCALAGGPAFLILLRRGAAGAWRA